MRKILTGDEFLEHGKKGEIAAIFDDEDNRIRIVGEIYASGLIIPGTIAIETSLGTLLTPVEEDFDVEV